jgi:hypothetical protein
MQGEHTPGAGDDVSRPDFEEFVNTWLPDGQGYVVADYGAALSYRTSFDSQWKEAGVNAALLLDDAVEVQVIRDGNPTVVSLPK